ncbi:hypothetical protein, partial [Photobacterium halotolerans]
MKWYKYLTNEHADGMVTNGCIKLGMLSGYRNVEAYGGAVGDTRENTRTVYSHDKHVKNSPAQLNPLERRLFNFDGSIITNFHFENNRIEIRDNGQD